MAMADTSESDPARPAPDTIDPETAELDAEGTLRVPVVEERAVVSKRQVERVGARIHLRTHEEEVPYSETLRRETIEVERVAVGTIVDEPPATREEGTTLVIPVVEEVLVKRYRIVEEVRVVPRVAEVEASDTVVLRRQEAVVERGEGPDE